MLHEGKIYDEMLLEFKGNKLLHATTWMQYLRDSYYQEWTRRMSNFIDIKVLGGFLESAAEIQSNLVKLLYVWGTRA